MDNYNGYGQPMYNQPYQQRQQPQMRRGEWTCRAVSCREEALAMPMDYMCEGILMPDVTHNAIYVKVLNKATGATNFCDFAAVPPPKTVQPEEFVKKEDFERLCEIVKKMQAGLGGERDVAEEN